MAKSMLRLQCNLCNYNMLVTEALEPWAMSVMEAHGKKFHPTACEPLPPKEEPNAEDPPSPSLPV